MRNRGGPGHRRSWIGHVSMLAAECRAAAETFGRVRVRPQLMDAGEGPFYPKHGGKGAKPPSTGGEGDSERWGVGETR